MNTGPLIHGAARERAADLRSAAAHSLLAAELDKDAPVHRPLGRRLRLRLRPRPVMTRC